MTREPNTRRPIFWRNLAWVFAAVAAFNLVVGAALVVDGTANGWVNVGLGAIFIVQAVLYVRLYRGMKRERDSENPK